MQNFKSTFEKLKWDRGNTVEVDFLLADDLFDQPVAPTDEDQLERITAADAIRFIREGQPLIQKRVIGDLILGKGGLANPYEFEIDGGRKVALSLVSAPPEFERTPFTSEIEVKGCLIEGKMQFSGLWFKGGMKFVGTTFKDVVEFQYSTFDKGVLFYQCEFREKVRFGDTSFYGTGHFDRTTFSGTADYYDAVFLKGAGFANSVFQAPCNFGQARFTSAEMLQPCLDFRNAVCYESTYFAGSKFEGVANFTGTQFHRQADFAEASFQYVNFTNVEFGRLDLKWEQIAGHKLLFGKTFLKDFDVSKLVVSQKKFDQFFKQRVDATLPDKHRQYDILKAIFSRQGDHVSADGCYYEWKQVERMESPLGLNPENWMIKAFHYLNWLSCGYGVKPLRTVFFSMVVVMVFAMAYLILDPNVHLTYIHIDNLIQANPQILMTFFTKIEFSFSTFMSFEASKSILAPVSQILYWIERLLGWLTLLLFVTTYTRLMLR